MLTWIQVHEKVNCCVNYQQDLSDIIEVLVRVVLVTELTLCSWVYMAVGKFRLRVVGVEHNACVPACVCVYVCVWFCVCATTKNGLFVPWEHKRSHI